MFLIPELTQLLRLKSITRKSPAKGKTGLGLPEHKMSILLPRPPASIITETFFIVHVQCDFGKLKTDLFWVGSCINYA